ncbi:hypothetical protein AWH56_002860 [Anaerobacillus isosaccharinicus]|uniref:Uncharacterized protein n=1 Tax=Anaerobacillus isosaccharinicus TaxID=1532552 RepID=A0A1S2M7C3_9BACI|nr:hypothetical protein [Anaerobacillus isosaccharinicus]MBA5585016.1 hypothetical protein [Anaerobacillus isosaccharinicus]QOY36632.1 hypothetical protein AWH56_002860 [Anaerobacillus isosaccharinicus]
MSSKKKMKVSKHIKYGQITAFDVEMNTSLKKGLICFYCGVPLTFVRTHIKNDTIVPCFFRLQRGMGEHLYINGKACPNNSENPDTTNIDNSKEFNYQIENSLHCRVNIPSKFSKELMEVLDDELLNISSDTEKPIKKSAGNFQKSGKIKSDYINSAKGFSVLANKYWPSNWKKLKEITFKLEDYTATVTARIKCTSFA